MAGGSRSSGRNFYPRPPRGGRLGAAAQIGEGKVDFYPRPPRGGRPGGGVLRVGINEFLSTPSARRATWRALARPTPTGYFYPRPPRGGRQRACRSLLKKSNFYPRPPRGGRRPQPPDRRRSGGDFYPRPPRGGRPLRADNVADGEDISIHALREEGDQDGQAKANRAAAISIHALREEGDRRTFLNLDEFGEFLSTPSARRATAALEKQEAPEPISIHALREEGDKAGSCDAALLSPISIHALREEGDRGAINKRRNEQYFYPRPPRGGRPPRPAAARATSYFYPRPPRGGRRSPL